MLLVSRSTGSYGRRLEAGDDEAGQYMNLFHARLSTHIGIDLIAQHVD